MRQDEYLAIFETELKCMLETTRSKNSDYAAASDAFKNFNMIETITDGRISAADGIFTRMCDKVVRIAGLLKGKKASVIDEKIEDSLLDLAVYAIILKIFLGGRNGFK